MCEIIMSGNGRCMKRPTTWPARHSLLIFYHTTLDMSQADFKLTSSPTGDIPTSGVLKPKQTLSSKPQWTCWDILLRGEAMPWAELGGFVFTFICISSNNSQSFSFLRAYLAFLLWKILFLIASSYSVAATFPANDLAWSMLLKWLVGCHPFSG